MTEQSRATLKSYFVRGNRPTQSNYADLIDSFALVAASGGGSTLTSAQVVMKTGDTMTGLLILSGNPAVANGAATKTYVDTADALRMLKTTYDGANISEQVIGVSASQTLYNKVVNGVTLTTGGSATQFLNGAGIYASVPSSITAATAQNSTSGTAIDFTGIPSTAKRITIILSGVSTNGTSNLLIQVGNGSFVTTGYAGAAMNTSGSGLNTINATNGLQLQASMDAPTGVVHGQIVATKITGNTWVLTATWGRSDAALSGISSATIALAGSLDRVRVTTVSGDTFDAGTINIMYE